MKRGIDTNVLINAILPALPDHRAVRRYLIQQLRNPEVALMLTPGIFHELLHVITDSRRFDPPVPMSRALSIAESFLGHSNVTCLTPDAATLRRLFVMMEKHALGRKRIADTLFAATLLEHGVTEVITLNPRDFQVFPELTLFDPRQVEG